VFMVGFPFLNALEELRTEPSPANSRSQTQR
jgi:hypothetical protein